MKNWVRLSRRWVNLDHIVMIRQCGQHKDGGPLYSVTTTATCDGGSAIEFDVWGLDAEALLRALP